jgi:16S rRNA pseudouridine516 synthase
MFAAVGNHVMALHRDRIGGLVLPDDLGPGDYQVLGAKDVDRIFASADT